MIYVLHWLFVLLGLITLAVLVPVIAGIERWFESRKSSNRVSLFENIKISAGEYKNIFGKYAAGLSIFSKIKLFSLPMIILLIFGILPLSPMFDGKLLVAGDFNFSILLLIFLLCMFTYVSSEYYEHKSLLVLSLTISVVSILCVIMSAESFKISDIVYSQIADSKGETKFTFMVLPAWFAFRQPIAFIAFIFSGFVLFNQLKFNIKTNYRVLRILEVSSLITFSAITVVIFLGSWHFPGLPIILNSHSSNFMAIIPCILIFLIKFLIVVILIIKLKSAVFRRDSSWLPNILYRIAFPVSFINLVYMLIIR